MVSVCAMFQKPKRAHLYVHKVYAFRAASGGSYAEGGAGRTACKTGGCLAVLFFARLAK